MFIIKKDKKLFLIAIIILLIPNFIFKSLAIAQNTDFNNDPMTESVDRKNDLATLFSVYKQIINQSRGKIINKKNIPTPKKVKTPVVKPNEFILNLIKDAESKGDLAPLYLNRVLQNLQSLLVRGDKDIQNNLPNAFAEVGNRLLALDPVIWSKKANIYALMCYTLNGGNPVVFNKIMLNDNKAEVPQIIIDGITAYINKDKQDFIAAFGDRTHYENVPLSLQASIDLHISNYYKYVDNEKAIDRLNFVRLMAKGTFFDEAATRNELYVVAKNNDINLFEILTRSYLKNFNKSPFLNKFWREYIASIALLKNSLSVGEMENLMVYVPLPIQNFLYLSVAKDKLLAGNLKEAKSFALKAIAIEDTNNYNTDHGLLYYASSLIPTSKAKQAENILKKLEPNKLSGADRALLKTSKILLNNMLADPKPITPVSGNNNMLNQSDIGTNTELSEKKINVDNLKQINENILQTINSSGEELKFIDNMLKHDDEKYAN